MPQPASATAFAAARADTGGVCLRPSRYAPAVRMAMHAHDRAALSVVASGVVFEDSPRGPSFVARAGDCILKPLGSPHENRFGGQATHILQLSLAPSDAAAPWLEALKGRGYGVVRSPQLSRCMLDLQRAVSAGRAEEALDDLLADVLGALSLLCGPITRQPPWLPRVERAIQEGLSLSAPLRVAELARTVGLHPGNLTRAFHAAYGQGVARYIRRCRVQRAAELLASGRTEICTIAQRAGFADQAHLTRSFREVLGTTPHAYRQCCG